jgi:apolipoprotein N-acyltransferase
MNRIKGWLCALALPVLAGSAAALGQAPWNLWPVALAGYAVLVHSVASAPARRTRVLRAWFAGAAHFATAMFWIVEPFLVDAARDGWMAPFALMLMSAGLGGFWALAAILAEVGIGRAGRTLGLAAGLAMSDLLRSYVLTGFPWALVGHIWIDTPIAQLSAFAGPIGLSLLTMLLVALPVAATGRSRRGLFAASLAAMTLLAAAWTFGVVRLAGPEIARDDPVRVRLVQPNATQSLKWEPGMWGLFMDRQLAASAAPSDAPLDLVVWPETAVPYLLDDAGDILQEAIAATGGVPVALGIQRAEGLRYFNALVAVGPGGKILASYDKVHLVPFGEYMPLGDHLARLGISALAAQAGNGYTAGQTRSHLDLGPAGRVLPLICYEAVFPQDMRAVPGRADWILQVTNDGWFGALAGPWQHLALARLRAIEQGLPLLRAANTGVSAGIDPKGRILGSLPLDTDGWLDIEVPAALAPTLYARTGDFPATMLLAGCFLALSLSRMRARH